MTVNPDNAKEEIERRMSDLVDLLAFFGDAKIDPRAWNQLLIYAPYQLIKERYDKIKPCVVCGDLTVMACSDCAIDSGGKTSVHVCTKSACMTWHERTTHGAAGK